MRISLCFGILQQLLDSATFHVAADNYVFEAEPMDGIFNRTNCRAAYVVELLPRHKITEVLHDIEFARSCLDGQFRGRPQIRTGDNRCDPLVAASQSLEKLGG